MDLIDLTSLHGTDIKTDRVFRLTGKDQKVIMFLFR